MKDEQWLALDWRPTIKGGRMLRSPICTVTVYPHKWQKDHWTHMVYFRGVPYWSYSRFESIREAQIDALRNIRKGGHDPSVLFPKLKEIA